MVIEHLLAFRRIFRLPSGDVRKVLTNVVRELGGYAGIGGYAGSSTTLPVRGCRSTTMSAP